MAKKIIDNRQPKKAWSFNIKTGELKHEVSVNPDPNDASNYLVPRGVVTIEPPKPKKGYTAFWGGEKWEMKKATV